MSIKYRDEIKTLNNMYQVSQLKMLRNLILKVIKLAKMKIHGCLQVKEAIIKALDKLSIYPDGNNTGLKSMAKKHNVEVDNVLLAII